MKPTTLLKILAFVLLICACKTASKIPRVPPGSMSLPNMPSSIDYDVFEVTTIKILIDPPLNLMVDTVYNHTISAYEICDGRVHRHWFFWKTTWKEKTRYLITYQKVGSEVIFTLTSQTFEAPNIYWAEHRWQRVEPSNKTKESMILEKLK
jgi:hypothetical protein